MKNILIEILKSEVKPAVGCTEPVAVALACAKAKELLGEKIEKCQIYVSPNVYKNGMCVGIPGTERLGLKIAAAMGLMGGKSELGLTVLEGLNSEELLKAEDFVDKDIIKISPVENKEKVFICVELEGEVNKCKAIIMTKHDNFVHLEKNDEVLLDGKISFEIKEVTNADSPLLHMTIKELIMEIEKMELGEIDFLLEGIEMNDKAAKYGVENKIGIGVGYGINKSIKEGLLGDDLINRAMMLTAGASDARMAGMKIPVMSSNGSGNHGLTAIIPISAYNSLYPQSDEKLAKALAISHLVTAYIKNYTGRLSAVCGCGVAASTGSSAGISWLMGSSYAQIDGAIENMIGNLSGMICDGAKAGCALKLASAASAAVQSAIISKYDCVIPPLNGIIGNKVEESIKNLGKVSSEGMVITDEVIINVMDSMN